MAEVSKQETAVRQRNLGVDFLRSLSMLMVVTLHFLGRGGVLASLPFGSVRYGFFWLVEVACYCAVNCFGLISGYVGHGERLSAEKLFSAWAQVAFYAVGVSAVFKLWRYDSVSWSYLLSGFFPAVTQKYWYYTAYFALMFLMPFLNRFLRELPRERIKPLLLTLILLFSVSTAVFRQDYFGLKGGYTVIWLTVLYLIGGCIRRLGPDWGPGRLTCLAGYVLSVVLAVGCKALILLFPSSVLSPYDGVLVSYTSPLMLLSGIFLLLLVRSFPEGRRVPARVIRFFAPLAFAAYLLQDHPLMQENLISECFAFLTAYPAALHIGAVLLAVFGTFIAGTAIEFVRQKLFKSAMALGSKVIRKFKKSGKTDGL